ncbi:MAG: hypothetical protein ACE3L7_20185 [Candidatus Pristimantibacillus sp.]
MLITRKFIYTPFIKTSIICVVCLFFKTLIMILNSKDLYFQPISLIKIGVSQSELNLILTLIALVSGTIAIIFKTKYTLVKVLILLLSTTLIIGNIFIWMILFSEAKYIFFTSPNNKENFVIKELKYSKIYQVSKTKLFTKHITDISGDDGYRMFSDNQYRLEWEEPNTLIIYYVFDYMHMDKFSKRTVKYTNN